MKRIVLLALFSISCVDVAQYQDASQRSGSSGSPSDPTSICAKVDRVRIVNYPASLAVNSSAGIDVTPRDEFGNIRPDECNEKDGNRWDSNDDTCVVACVTCFNTNVKGVKVGTCKLTATVSGKSDSVEFPVQ